MIDKMIHADEFRLRILLTNDCNKNCSFCLNDFQPKKPRQFANPTDVTDCIRAYGQFMKSIGEQSIVTFSGGEPGLYPHLNLVLPNAKHYCDVVKVVTNGLALEQGLNPYVDKWHVGVTGPNVNVLTFKELTDKISVQLVVTDRMHMFELVETIAYYRKANIIVKLFVDFFSKDKQTLENRIKYLAAKINGVCTRFTGKQINRGPACNGCEKECVTLKALWYFPDGSSSTCPQGVKQLFDDDCWDETVEKAYRSHEIMRSPRPSHPIRAFMPWAPMP